MSALGFRRVWRIRAGRWTPWSPLGFGSDEPDRRTVILSLPYPGSPAIVIALWDFRRGAA